MGAAGQPVQWADAEGGMGVQVGTRRLMFGRKGMKVKVNMSFAVRFVFVRVNIFPDRDPQCPQTDAEEHHSHKPFAPRGKPRHGD
jgi:hypothetical protein